jgi:hypothetical protein
MALEESLAGSVVHCPVCALAFGETDQDVAPLPDYEMHPQEGPAHQTIEVQDYVKGLEKRARQERKREPYRRRRFPVELVTGLLLMGCGVRLMVTALTGAGGLFTTFINVVLPSFILFLAGVLCLTFRPK